ncbi:hypothetical protein BDB01DRAFT_837842 [Pilobolus umbonatus]|nr:hypothetical protein BDB01DRAFT_837842 [Pilobolus umbonatus]
MSVQLLIRIPDVYPIGLPSIQITDDYSNTRSTKPTPSIYNHFVRFDTYIYVIHLYPNITFIPCRYIEYDHAEDLIPHLSAHSISSLLSPVTSLSGVLLSTSYGRYSVVITASAILVIVYVYQLLHRHWS